MVVGVGGVGGHLDHRLLRPLVVPVVELLELVPEPVQVDPGGGRDFAGQSRLHGLAVGPRPDLGEDGLEGVDDVVVA